MKSNTDLREAIKQWYKELPEITLPNIDSEDGTYMELNLVDLVEFIQDHDKNLRDELVKALPNEATETKSFGKDYIGYSRGYNASLFEVKQKISGVFKNEM